MRILVINPNSSVQMTADIERSACAVAPVSVEVDTVRMPGSPEVLESYRDYAVAAEQMVRFLENGGAATYDGVLISCFGDPGLAACKELIEVPCIGIAEASMARAQLLGTRFSILAASDKASWMMNDLVCDYGLEARSAGSLSLGASIEEFLGDAGALRGLVGKTLAKQSAQADVLIYGCAGMCSLDVHALSRELGIEVIDPVACGVTTLIGLVADGVRVSRRGSYAAGLP